MIPRWQQNTVIGVFVFLLLALATARILHASYNPENTSVAQGEKQIERQGDADNEGVGVKKGWIELHHDLVDGVSVAVTALFTIILGVSTVLLWCATSEAAKIARRALTELERPFVFAEASDPTESLGTAGWDAMMAAQRGEIKITLHNYGRTPAVITRLWMEPSSHAKGAQPAPINPLSVGGRELPVGVVAVADRPYSESENIPTSIFTDAEEIAAGRLIPWIVGFARYTDIFDRHHITGFTQRFDVVGKRFVVWGDKRYNYARTEREGEIPSPTVIVSAPKAAPAERRGLPTSVVPQ
jgi:hypothetical protein